MSTGNQPGLDLALASAKNEILANTGRQADKTFQQNQQMISDLERHLRDKIEGDTRSVLAKVEETKESKFFKVALALSPVLATAFLGWLVWEAQLSANEKIENNSKQLASRLVLTEEFYKRKFDVYQDAYKKMLRLLAAVKNLELNRQDANGNKEAVTCLNELYLSSQTNGLYMTDEVSKGLQEVWNTALTLPQFDPTANGNTGALKAKITEVEKLMQNELVGNIAPLQDAKH